MISLCRSYDSKNHCCFLCINYLSFTFLFVVFHPSPHFSIFFEILNETKLIHHYENCNSYKINPILNGLLPKSILVITIYYFFCFGCLFKCKYVKLWLLVIKESIECQIFPIVPHFLTPFNNSFHLSFIS